MEIVFKIALFIAGLFLLYLTYKMYRKDWKAPTWICALLGILALLGTQGWVQGFFKTGILSLGYEYGDRLNNYQETVGKIETTVRRHQGVLDRQQGEITEQQTGIKTAQGRITEQQQLMSEQQSKITDQQTALDRQRQELQSAQKDIIDVQGDIRKQQERLADVENLVVDIFSRTRSEVFRPEQTNAVMFITKQDGAHIALFRLAAPPFQSSVEGMYGQTPLLRTSFRVYGNILATVWKAEVSSYSNETYTITYVINPKEKQTFKAITMKEGQVFLDSLRLPSELMP